MYSEPAIESGRMRLDWAWRWLVGNGGGREGALAELELVLRIIGILCILRASENDSVLGAVALLNRIAYIYICVCVCVCVCARVCATVSRVAQALARRLQVRRTPCSDGDCPPL